MNKEMEKSMKVMLERAKMVHAMEFIARQINDEDVFFRWLTNGVADGDIDYGDLNVKIPLEEDIALDYITDDDSFAELMNYFLYVMTRAYKSGGLYCGDVVSKEMG